MSGRCFQIYNSRSCNIRSKATSPSCSSSSLRVNLSNVHVGTHDVLSGACAPPPSLRTPEVFSPPPYTTIWKKITPEDLPYHKDALFIQVRTTLLHNLTNLTPTCVDICLQVLVIDRQLSSTIYQNPGEVEVREFRDDYSGWTIDKETIRL